MRWAVRTGVSRAVHVRSAHASCGNLGPADGRGIGSLAGHADVVAVPAHVARRSGRRRGRQPPPAGPGGLHPARRGRHLLVAAARPPGAAPGRADRPRGDGSGRRAGDAAADHAAARAVAAQRPRRDVRPAHVPPRSTARRRGTASRPPPRRSSRRWWRRSTGRTATCRSTSTRSTGSTATSCGRGSGCCAAASS